MAAATLSKRVGITRTLVYKVLTDLEAKGLVSKDESFKVTRFSAAHPYELRKLADQQKITAENFAHQIETALAPLVATYNLQSHKPGVHHMEGLSGIDEVLKDTLTSSEPIYMYVDTDTLEQELLDIDEKYVPKRLKKGIVKKMLMARTPAAEQYARESQTELTQVKLIASADTPQFYTLMYIYDKKVSYITYKNGQFTSTIIYDESIYTMHRFLFEAQWGCA